MKKLPKHCKTIDFIDFLMNSEMMGSGMAHVFQNHIKVNKVNCFKWFCKLFREKVNKVNCFTVFWLILHEKVNKANCFKWFWNWGGAGFQGIGRIWLFGCMGLVYWII